MFGEWQGADAFAGDGQGGVLVGLLDSNNQPLIFVSSTGATYAAPVSSFQVVLGENGTAFAAGVSSVASFKVNSGAINWTYQAPPQTTISLIGATANGGVAINNLTNGIFQLDANGAPTQVTPGNSASLPAYSWSGDLYGIQTGTQNLAEIVAPTADWAVSSWALLGGDQSGNKLAVQQPWFPPLPTCPGAQTPCAGEATWSAFKSLKMLMAGSCPLCNTSVFNKLGKSQQQFSVFLALDPLLSDGTRSNGPMNSVMCNWYDLLCPFGNETVTQNMTRKGSGAISRTPSPKGAVIFFNPVFVCTAGTSPGTLLNEASLFHELLHSFTGLYDSELANALGVSPADYSTFGSVSISYYLEMNVFGSTLHYHDPGGNKSLVCQN